MSGDKQLEERRKYVTAFNATMIKIWREQINLLGVIDTGALYRSTVAVRMTADGKFTQITLVQSFNAYGIFVRTTYGVCGGSQNRRPSLPNCLEAC